MKYMVGTIRRLYLYLLFSIYILYLGPELVITVLDCCQQALLTRLLIKKIVFRKWVMNICTLQSGYL